MAQSHRLPRRLMGLNWLCERPEVPVVVDQEVQGAQKPCDGLNTKGWHHEESHAGRGVARRQGERSCRTERARETVT